MKKIYEARGLAELKIISDYLNQESIQHFVKNKDLVDLQGEIPLADASPSIWVEEDEFEKAMTAIANFNKEPANTGSFKCACGELLESQFTTCWKCGRSRD